MNRCTSHPTGNSELHVESAIELGTTEHIESLRRSGQSGEAVRFLRSCIADQPGDHRLHLELGKLLVDLNRHEEAIGSFLAAHQLKPDYAAICNQLGRAFSERGWFKPAAQWFERGHQLDPADTRWLYAYGYSLRETGCNQLAAEVFERCASAEPCHPIARHLSIAALGDRDRGEPPVNYIRSLFNDYASEFDKSLLHLKYCGPRLVLDALESISDRPGDGWDILDVGCGTGLVGSHIKPLARRLVGVDLSTEMLALARAKNVYDELIEAEMIDYLRCNPSCFDVLTAADVLSYLGDLEAFFRAAANAIRPGGNVVVMVEELADEGNWRLNASGRYCHNSKYLHSAMLSAGFSVSCVRNEAMRYELLRPVATIVAIGSFGGNR